MEKFKCSIEQGAMTNAPVWETHKRGTNYAAIIHVDPASPGGLGRKFLARAKGDYYYFTNDLYINAVVEFAGDYTSGGGNRSRRRVYAVVTLLTVDSIEFDLFDSHSQAFQFAKENAEPKQFSLSQTLDEVSNDFINANYITEVTADKGIYADGSNMGLSSVKFFSTGHAAIFVSKEQGYVLDFISHQDAVDFIRVK